MTQNLKKAIKTETRDYKREQKRRVNKVATCNPEGPNGWKTYQELRKVTLFHEPCNENEKFDCFSGAIFNWVGNSSGDNFKCAVGFPQKKDDLSNFVSMKLEPGQNVTKINYSVAPDGQLPWFEVVTDSNSVDIGTNTVSEFTTHSIDYDQKVLGLYVDATEGYITDFGTYQQNSEACNCENQSEVIKSNFHENMVAVKRDARQKINAITNVGPSHVWNYCGKPTFSFNKETPEWFNTDGNKITVSRSEDVEGIFTFEGSMNVGSFAQQGRVNAYVNTLVDCDELS